jgi:hypothetical protein
MCDLYRFRRCIALYLRRSIQNHIEQGNEMENVVSLSDVISSFNFAIKARFVFF